MPEESKDKQGGQKEVNKPDVGALSTPVNFFAQRSGLMTDNYTVGTTTLDGRAITNEIPLPPTPATNPTLPETTEGEAAPASPQEDPVLALKNFKEFIRLESDFTKIDDEIEPFVDQFVDFPDDIREGLHEESEAVKRLIGEIKEKEFPTTDDITKLAICIINFRKTFYDLKDSLDTTPENDSTVADNEPAQSQPAPNEAEEIIEPNPEVEVVPSTQEIKSRNEQLITEAETLKIEFDNLSLLARHVIARTKNDDVKKNLRGTIKKIESELEIFAKTPTKEHLRTISTLIDGFTIDATEANSMLLGEEAERDRLLSQSPAPTASPAPTPAPASSPAPKPAPDTTSPDNRATSIESDLGLTNDQLFLTQPENIVRIEDSDKWMLVSPNGDSRHLEKDEENIWRMCQEEFARYEKYINEKTNSELLKQYLPLIEAKMDLIDVLEKRGLRVAWGAGHAFSLLLDKAERGELLEAITPSAPSQATPIAPSNPTTSPSSPEQYTSEQIYVTKPGNIYYDENFVRKGGALRAKGKSKGAWVINGYGKKSFNPEPLHSGDYMEWKNCMFELERYATFINQIPKEELRNYTQLIEAKVNLIKTLKEKGFEHAREFGEKLNEMLNRAVSGEFDTKKEPARATIVTAGSPTPGVVAVPAATVGATTPTPPTDSPSGNLNTPITPDVDAVKKRKVRDVRVKSIKLDKIAKRWKINGRPLSIQEDGIWQKCRYILIDYQKYFTETRLAHAFPELIELKNDMIDALEAEDFTTAKEKSIELAEASKPALEILESVRAYNKKTLEKGYTLTPDGTDFAFVKYPILQRMDDKLVTRVIDKKTGDWTTLDEQDSSYVQDAYLAVNHFSINKPKMSGFILLKNRIIQLVNDYQFKEASQAANEYFRLTRLPIDQLPPDFDKTIFTGTLGSVTSVPSGSPSPATASGGAGGIPPVPPPPAGPPSGPPAPPTPPSGPTGPTGPGSPDREPSRLDVAGGWPVTIFRKEIGGTKGTRGRIEWYKVEANGQETRLQNSNEWNAFHEEFSLDFKNYTDLMFTGRAKERLKKEELYQSLLLAKKNLIDAIKNADLDTARSLLKVFTTELIDAEEDWENTKPKLQEEAKLLEGNAKAREQALKDFEGREVWCGKYLARINTIDSQLEQTSLDRDFLNRRRNYVNDLFKRTKELFGAGEFDNKAYTTFVTTLDALEKDDQLSKLENKIAHINPHKAVSASSIPGVVAGQQKVLRTRGRAPITVDQWNREQVDAQVAKDAYRVADSDVNRLDTGIAKYSAAKYSEYHQDPVAFVVKHLDDRWTSILTKEEKAVVEGILAKVPDDVLMEARAESRTANKLARDRTAAGMTRQVFSPMTTDKKEDKRVLQEIKAEKKLTDEEVLARRTEDSEKGRPIDASQTDPSYATLTGRMVNSANSPLENNAGARATAVNNVLNKNVARSKGVWWKLLSAAIVGGALAFGMSGDTDNTRGKRVTATTPSNAGTGIQSPDTSTIVSSTPDRQPMGWRDYLKKESTPEFQREVLKDFEELSTEEFLAKRLPSLVSTSNPSSIKKILDLDAYTLRLGQDSLPDISDPDRKILADLLSEVRELYSKTQAPILAGDVKGNTDTSAYYIDLPYNQGKITLGEYFNMFKAAKFAADTRDQAQLGKK